MASSIYGHICCISEKKARIVRSSLLAFHISSICMSACFGKYNMKDHWLFFQTSSSFLQDSDLQDKTRQIGFLWPDCLTTYEENHFVDLKSFDESLLLSFFLFPYSYFLFASCLVFSIPVLVYLASSWNILVNLL